MNELLTDLGRLDYIDWFQIFALVFITPTYYFVLRRTILKKRTRKFFKKKELMEVLSSGFENGSISSFKEIDNIYKGVYEISKENSRYKYDLAKDLRVYLNNFVYSNDNMDLELQSAIKKMVSDAIDTCEESTSFAELPILEQNILLDLITYSEQNNKSDAKRKIDELANIIEIRNNELNNIMSVNKWSVPLAGIGLVLTVIFGLLSMFN